MGYIEQSLGQNETLIYKARFHWLYYAAAWTALILLIVFVFLIIFLRYGMSGVGAPVCLHRIGEPRCVHKRRLGRSHL